MTDASNTAERYIAIWNEEDADRRRALIADRRLERRRRDSKAGRSSGQR